MWRGMSDEEDVAKVEYSGKPCRLTLYAFAGQVLSGKVARIYDQADDLVGISRWTSIRHPQRPLPAGNDRRTSFRHVGKAERPGRPQPGATNRNSIYIIRDGKIEKSDAVIGLKSIDESIFFPALSLETRS